jgi:hypothetical protein
VEAVGQVALRPAVGDAGGAYERPEAQAHGGPRDERNELERVMPVEGLVRRQSEVAVLGRLHRWTDGPRLNVGRAGRLSSMVVRDGPCRRVGVSLADK